MTRIGVYAVDRTDPPDQREYRRLAVYDTETREWAPTSDHEMATVAPAGEKTLSTLSRGLGGRAVVVADVAEVPEERTTVEETTPTVTDRPVSVAPRPYQRGDGPWETVAPTAVTGVIYDTADKVAVVETDGRPGEFHLQVPTALDRLPRPVTAALAAALLDLVALPETVDDGWVAPEAVDLTPVEWAIETVAQRAGPEPDPGAVLGALGVIGDADRERVAAALVDLRAAARAVARGETPPDLGPTDGATPPTTAPTDDRDAVGVPGTTPPNVDRETVGDCPPTPWTHPVDRLLAALAGG